MGAQDRRRFPQVAPEGLWPCGPPSGPVLIALPPSAAGSCPGLAHLLSGQRLPQLVLETLPLRALSRPPCRRLPFPPGAAVPKAWCWVCKDSSSFPSPSPPQEGPSGVAPTIHIWGKVMIGAESGRVLTTF